LKAPRVELVHAPADAPESPRSRDWATGYFKGPPPKPPRFDVPWPLGPLADYRATVARMRDGKDLFIYQLVGWVPRFRFIDSVVAEPTGKAVLDRLESSDGDRTAVLRQED